MSRLSSRDIKTIEKAMKATGTAFNKDYKLKDNLLCLIDELLFLIEDKEDEIKSLESDIANNYRPIPNSDLEYPYD